MAAPFRVTTVIGPVAFLLVRPEVFWWPSDRIVWKVGRSHMVREFRGRVAVITGAADGIGRAVAQRLDHEGCDLALVDINQSGLEEAGASFRRAGRQVSTHVADVSNRSQMERLPELVLQHHRGVDLLVNNAGVICVFPGPVNTGLIRNGRAVDANKQKLETGLVAARGIPLEKVADRIVRGIQRNTSRVLIGKETFVIDAMARITPALTNWLAGRLWRRVPFLSIPELMR